MDYNLVIQFISSVGFPIFIVLWMLKYYKEETQKTLDTLNQINVSIVKLCDSTNSLIEEVKDLQTKMEKYYEK